MVIFTQTTFWNDARNAGSPPDGPGLAFRWLGGLWKGLKETGECSAFRMLLPALRPSWGGMGGDGILGVAVAVSRIPSLLQSLPESLTVGL